MAEPGQMRDDGQKCSKSARIQQNSQHLNPYLSLWKENNFYKWRIKINLRRYRAPARFIERLEIRVKFILVGSWESSTRDNSTLRTNP